MNDSPGNSGDAGSSLSERSPATSAASAAPGKRISSAELFAGAREVLIDHSGATYRLRHTSQGKLILTK